MGKFGTYVVIMSGLMLLFYFTGLLESTPSSTLLNLLLDPIAFQTNVLTTEIIIIFSGIAATAIIVGLVSRANTELIFMGAFTIFLFGLLWDFIAVAAVVFNINPVLGILVFSPLFILWSVTAIEWFRGTTT